MNYIPPAVGASTGLLDGVVAARYPKTHTWYRATLAATGVALEVARVVPDDVAISMQVCGLYGFASSLAQRASGGGP